MAVVEAVAERKNVDPVEVGPLEYEIDPDALDRLVASMDAGTVTFEFEGIEVAVDADGGVELGRRAREADLEAVAD